MLDERCGYCRYCQCDAPDIKKKDNKYYCDREDAWVELTGTPIKRNCFWQVRSAITNDRWRLMSNHYITTILVLLLGYERDCYELNTLEWFRTSVMEKNPEYKELLSKYDSIGPIIADKLEKTANKDLEGYKENMQILLNKYVRTTCNYINKGKNYLSLNDSEMADIMFKRAIVIYSSMVNNLYNEFCSTYTEEESYNDEYTTQKQNICII